MKHSGVRAASFAAGLAASLAGAPPARGVDVPFTDWVISNSTDGARSVFATDMDGDGDIDVLSASSDDNKIVWYENDGASPPTFTEHVIPNTADGALSVFATDVDGDGDIDVLSASFRDDKIAWYESDGGSPPTFFERVITEDPDGPGGLEGFADSAQSVFAADVNGDGRIDVLSASSRNDTIAWYENDGGSPPTFTARVITEDPDGPGGVEGFANFPVSVFAADVNGDGRIDVLSASWIDDKIAWYENQGGSPPTFAKWVITEDPDGPGGLEGFADSPRSVFATDVNGDGRMDVLSASFFDDKIAWYENDGGSPPTFAKWVITEDPDGPGGLDGFANGALSVFATDVDGDGDTDVLSASSAPMIAWYESDGLSSPSFIEREISTAAIGARSVFATDLDGDGDTDVLSASSFADKIAWYENTPTPPPPPTPSAQECQQLGITVPAGFVCDVFATRVQRAFGIAVAPPTSPCAGDLFVASNLGGPLGDGFIWHVTSPGAICAGADPVTNCRAFLSPIEWPDGLAFDAAGNLFVGQSGGGSFSAREPCKILKITIGPGCSIQQVEPFANIFDADGLTVDYTVDSDGSLLVASGRSNAGVLKLSLLQECASVCPCVCRTCVSCGPTANCSCCERVASTLPDFFGNPNAVVVNTRGDIFTVGGANTPVVKIDPFAMTVKAIEFATNVGEGAFTLAMRSSDDVLFVGDTAGTIYMFDSRTQTLPITAADPGDVFATGFGSSIASMAFDSAGSLYIGRINNQDILRISPISPDNDGDGIPDAIEDAVGGQGIDIDGGLVTCAELLPDGTIVICVTDSITGQVFTFTLPPGTQTTLPGDAIELEITGDEKEPKAQINKALLPPQLTKSVTLPWPDPAVNKVIINDSPGATIADLSSTDGSSVIEIPPCPCPAQQSTNVSGDSTSWTVTNNGDDTVTVSGLENTALGVTGGCGTLLVQVNEHTVGEGNGSTIVGIEGLQLCVFDKSAGSCARNIGTSKRHYSEIFTTCDAVACATTDADGAASINLEAGDYVLIGEYDPDGFPPNDDGDELYIGVSASDFDCAPNDNPNIVTMRKHLQVIILPNGRTVGVDPQGGGSGRSTENEWVEITNVAGPDDSVSVITANEDLDAGVGASIAIGPAIGIDSSLSPGQLFMTIVIPFHAEDLGGREALSVDLTYYNWSTGNWELAVGGNAQRSPDHGLEVIGDRFAVMDTTIPPLSGELGDYGVFWNPDAGAGFVWGNVDFTAEFATGPPTQAGPIPTVSEWGLVVLTLLGMTAGTIVLARRQSARRTA